MTQGKVLSAASHTLDADYQSSNVGPWNSRHHGITTGINTGNTSTAHRATTMTKDSFRKGGANNISNYDQRVARQKPLLLMSRRKSSSADSPQKREQIIRAKRRLEYLNNMRPLFIEYRVRKQQREEIEQMQRKMTEQQRY